MPRRNKERDEKEALEQQIANQKAELSDLRFRSRKLEVKHSSFKKKTLPIVDQQDKALSILATERVDIGDTKPKPADLLFISHMKDGMLSATDTREDLKKELNKEEARGRKLDTEITKVRKQIVDFRKQNGISCEYLEVAKEDYAKKKHLEDTAEFYTQRLGSVLADNARMREVITGMRTVKKLYTDCSEKLSQEIKECRVETKIVMKDTALVFEDRDELYHKLMTVREMNIKDEESHAEECGTLSCMIEELNRLIRFLKTREDERLELRAIERDKIARAVRDDKDIFDEDVLEAFDYSLNRVSEIMHSTNVVEIINTLQLMEDDRFGLFSYVNELNTQSQQLKEELKFKREKMAKFSQKLEQAEAALVDRNDEMADKIRAAVYKRDARGLSQTAIDEVLDHVQSSVTGILVKMDCLGLLKKEHVEDGQPALDHKNLESAIKAIERRTGDLLSTDFYKKYKISLGVEEEPDYEGDNDAKVRIVTPVPVTAPIHVKEPDLDDEDRTTDPSYLNVMCSKVLSPAEVRDYVIDEMHSKEIGTFRVKRLKSKAPPKRYTLKGDAAKDHRLSVAVGKSGLESRRSSVNVITEPSGSREVSPQASNIAN